MGGLFEACRSGSGSSRRVQKGLASGFDATLTEYHAYASGGERREEEKKTLPLRHAVVRRRNSSIHPRSL